MRGLPGTMLDQSSGSDEDVLRRAALRGDTGAWRVLYERAFDALWSRVRNRAGGRRDLAEEIVQETWMVAVRKLHAFDPSRGPFAAWLAGIADNLLRNRWRAPQEPAPLEAEPVAAERSGVRDVRERLALAMAALPADYQDVLRAKYEDALAVDEIAATRGRTAKAIESLLSRARAALREACRRLER